MKAAITLFLLFILSGCTTLYKPTEIPVPIKCPVPEIPPFPILAITDIKKGSAPDFIAKSYVATIYQLLADNRALRAQLAVYKN